MTIDLNSIQNFQRLLVVTDPQSRTFKNLTTIQQTLMKLGKYINQIGLSEKAKSTAMIELCTALSASMLLPDRYTNLLNDELPDIIDIPYYTTKVTFMLSEFTNPDNNASSFERNTAFLIMKAMDNLWQATRDEVKSEHT